MRPAIYIAVLTVLLAPDVLGQARGDSTGAARSDTIRTREVSISADLLEGDAADGERIRRLVGNVALRQEDTRLWARRATQYLDRREILFSGDVLVVERGDSLRADTVLYNSRTKTGRARGSVRLSDGDVIVYAPSGLYFTREKRAQFTEGVTLIDSSATLRSREGEYWSDEKRAEFYHDVVLDEDRTHLEADSVTYLRETDVSIARGNVFIERMGDEEEDASDASTRTLLFGERAFNDEVASFSRIEGTPLLVQIRYDSTSAEFDTLMIRAAVIESSLRDSLRRLVALDSVRIWQQELASAADSVVYDRISVANDSIREEVRLYRNPVAWFEDNQVTGDTLRIIASGGSVDTLLVRNNAFVARLDSALQRIQQLKGRHLVATFRSDSLRTLSVGPRAEAINFRGDENGEPAGAVQMSADRIIFYFANDELSRLSAIRGTEGTYYSEELIPENFQLDGFRWTPERRPERDAMLGDVVVPADPDAVLPQDEAKPAAEAGSGADVGAANPSTADADANE